MSKFLSAERHALTAYAPPCSIIEPNPKAASTPLILASPHSGALYPPSWLRRCAVPLSALRQSEDAFVDDLFRAGPQLGAPLLRAHFPRSFVDVNRAADELPPQWSLQAGEPSALARAGLGVIPLCISRGVNIYKQTPPPAIAAPRIDALYHPYHTALRGLIARVLAKHGFAALIDCHSMPGFGPQNSRHPDFILGDRYGRSCPQSLTDHTAKTLTAMGYSVGRNSPYAGGYTTRHYGEGGDNVHALQIEINRDLYLNAHKMSKKPGYEKLQNDLGVLTQSLITHYAQSSQSLAAQ
ncbi:MAG: N-formylglutamate amidohydrolase [Robiginitomaculum sp.]